MIKIATDNMIDIFTFNPTLNTLEQIDEDRREEALSLCPNSPITQYVGFKGGERISLFNIMVNAMEIGDRALFDKIVGIIRKRIPKSSFRLYNFLFKLICTKYGQHYDGKYSAEELSITDKVNTVVANNKYLFIDARGTICKTLLPLVEGVSDYTVTDELVKMIKNDKYWLWLASLYVKDSKGPKSNYIRLLYAVRLNRVEDIKRLKSLYDKRITFKKGDYHLLDIIKSEMETEEIIKQAIKIGYNSIAKSCFNDKTDWSWIVYEAYFSNNVDMLDYAVKNSDSNFSQLLTSMLEGHPDTIEYIINRYSANKLEVEEYRTNGYAQLAMNGYADLLNKYDKNGEYNTLLFGYYCEHDDLEGAKNVELDDYTITFMQDYVGGDEIDAVKIAEHFFNIGKYNNYSSIACIAIARGREDLWQRVKWYLIRDAVKGDIGDLESFIGSCATFYRFDIIKELISMNPLLPYDEEDYIELCKQASYIDSNELISYSSEK